MILNPEWQKPKEKPYFHQISLDCIEKLVKYIEMFHNGMDAVTALKTCEKILANEIKDEEFLSFAIENIEELFSYIAKGNLSIRIHRNDADEIWFDVDKE